MQQEEEKMLEEEYGERIVRTVMGFRLRQDILFRYVMKDNIVAVQELVWIYLGRKIEFLKVEVQAFQPMLESRSGIYDLRAESADEVIIIEMQDRIKGDEHFRCRYYNGISDTDTVLRGHPFTVLKKLTILVLAGGDVMGKGQPVYTNRMYVEELGIANPYIQETHVFVNINMVEGDSAIAKANHDLGCDKAENMNYSLFAQLLTKGQGETVGVRDMCDAVKKLVEEERTEAIAEERANIDSRIAEAVAEEKARTDIKIAEAVAEEKARTDIKIAEAVAEEKARTDIATATRMLKIGKYSHDEISKVSTLSRGEVDHLAISMGL